MKHASVEIVSLVTFSNSVISLTMFTNIYYVDDTRNFSIMLIYLNLSFRVQELQN